MRMRWIERVSGSALFVLLVAHAALNPERGWTLLWGCDLAVAVMALGLVAGLHAVVAVAFLFHVAVGLPAFTVAVLTHFEPGPTSIAIHLLPPIAGGLSVARRGLPRGAALWAWL